MKIRIKGTGELKELRVVGNNGVEWTGDLLGNYDATTHNRETEEHEMSSTDFEWWDEYICHLEKDASEIAELAEEFGIDESKLWDRINENMTGELGDEHQIKQNFIVEIKSERETFKEMIRDWKADRTEEMNDIEVTEIVQEDGQWVAMAHDGKTSYTLTDDGHGNIVLNYLDTR